MKASLIRSYATFAGVVLIFTALTKLASACGQARLLDMPDPLLAIPNRQLMVGVALAELAVAGVAIFSKKNDLKLYLIAFIGTNFLVYRAGLWLCNISAPCKCLGTLTDVIPLSPLTIEWILRGVLTYLVAGSYMLLFIQWWTGRGNYTAAADNAIAKPS